MKFIVYKETAAWLKAYAQAAAGLPLGFDQTPEWFQIYAGHIPEASYSPVLAAVVDEETGKLLLGVPLTLSSRGRLHIRSLDALSNYYTSLFDPLMPKGQSSESDVVSFFLSALGNGPLQWDEVSLEPMSAEAPFFRQLCHALDSQAYTYSISECFTNWYLETDGQGYAEYEETLPSKLRNTLHRKRRKLEREHTSTIHIIQNNTDLAQYIDDYEKVYQNSWKPEESHPAFIRTIIERFAQKGWLRLGLMYIEEVPVAAQLWFVKAGVASIYKLSYDERYAGYSVGSLLTSAMMKQVLDVDRVKSVDFLTGNDAYKKDWMSHCRNRYRIRIYNRSTWRGRILALWNTKVKNQPKVL